MKKHPILEQTALAARISVPFADKPQVLQACKDWLEEAREAVKAEFLGSNKIAKLLVGQTKIVDSLLGVLYKMAEDEAAGLGAKIALVAGGGYGRGELFPYSDIDILFLYDHKNEEQAAEIVEQILYILWDLGFKVGQAHRTIKEAIELAKNDITIRTNLLDARLIAGDIELFSNFETRFNAELIKGKELEFVEAKLAERDARHQRFGDSRYMLEPNVKEGKGGLRDAHTLWWLVRAAYGIASIGELVEKGLVSREEYKAFEQAQTFLCSVRAHLHYIAGRAEDRLTFDYQHALAVAMGFSHPSINRAIERFMRRYFVAVRTVSSTTRVFCALLEDEKKRKPRNPFASLRNIKWGLNYFKLDGERLNVKTDNLFEHTPFAMLELFHVAQKHNLDIHPHALKLVASNLHRIDDNFRADPKANEIFLEILLSKKSAETTLRKISDVGVLGRFIREFGRIIGQTQFNMYHVFTVDEHTLVAIGVLHAIESGSLKKIAPMASDIIHRIALKRVLYLALFCHDIAKGQGGDHSVLGEKVAMRLAKRFGFSDDEAQTTGWLVQNHLLFSNTATKRDLNDPKTVQDFVAIVQSPERLKLLLVLTVADIRAVSPHAWNNWKAGLLRELYTRAQQCMGTGKIELKQGQENLFIEDLKKLLIGWNEKEILHYQQQGTPSFWTSVSPSRHAVIANMVRAAEDSAHPLLIDTQHDYENSITEIIVCTLDSHGLFSKVAGAMSLAGANIISAKIFTLKNGIAVEIFQIQDLSGEVFDNAGRLAKMSVYIEQVLSSEIKLEEEFKNRSTARKIQHSRSKSVPLLGQVLVDNEASHIHSVIELMARDRTGLLHDVTRVIAELGLSIVTAHISTYGTQVADVFYVKDNFGMKILSAAKTKQIREKLLEVV